MSNLDERIWFTTGQAAAIREAGEVLAMAEIAAEQMTPRDLAEACYTPTGPPVDELEDRIRSERGLPPIDRGEDGEEGQP